jgi:hypothetical protein
MRHYSGMKAIPCLLLCFAFCAAADEAADRAAICRDVALLNMAPQPSTLFTADASSDLDRLPKPQPVSFRILLPPDDSAAHPTVTISHEYPNPRIACGSIRFITPDVALADGNWTYENGPETQTKPLLFVMKKEADGWKIASLRLLEPRPAN